MDVSNLVVGIPPRKRPWQVKYEPTPEQRAHVLEKAFRERVERLRALAGRVGCSPEQHERILRKLEAMARFGPFPVVHEGPNRHERRKAAALARRGLLRDSERTADVLDLETPPPAASSPPEEQHVSLFTPAQAARVLIATVSLPICLWLSNRHIAWWAAWFIFWAINMAASAIGRDGKERDVAAA